MQRTSANNRSAAMAVQFLALVILITACSDDDSVCPCNQTPEALASAGPFLYDGSYSDPIGPFRITDLRSNLQVVDGDTVDTYTQMEDYETRNLSVYYPEGASQAPVVFYIHGGGWTDGYMEWYDFVAESFTRQRGWVTVVINYRLTSDQVFPTAICSTRTSEAPDPSLKAAWYPDNLDDCANALQWTIENVTTYGGDPAKIFLFGHSAGAHLATLLAAHGDYADLRSRIRGLISMSGGYRLTELNPAIFASALEQTFGTATDEAILDSASPTTYLSGAETLFPMLLLHAADDLPSLSEQAIAFSEKLVRLGYDHELQRLEGYGHVSEMQAFEFADEEPTQLVIGFIEDVLEAAPDGP